MQQVGENTSNTPAFLGKLWKMVNDPSTDQLISWSPAGNSFVIQNQALFWYELLPVYYKHNNMSSFVRQLNMYGFHKVPTVENGSMDSDKDEIQFFHPYFQKGQPELLKNIKRKATTTKLPVETDSTKHNDLSKVLNDVKQLRGRQDSIDSQLSAMKQENGLVWRELAFLRQKHLKQQKIVNKLIQFLMTLVQPTRMSVGVKRGYPLMIHENPAKKTRNNSKCSNTTEGPTIHELDGEIGSNDDLEEDENPVIDESPTSFPPQKDATSPAASQFLDEGNWDKPELVVSFPRVNPQETNNLFQEVHSKAAADDLIINDNELAEENLMNALEQDSSQLSKENREKIFLNPQAQDAMLINLIKNNEEISTTNGNENGDKNKTIVKEEPSSSNAKFDMTVATREPNVYDIVKNPTDFYPDEFDNHIETTQSELDQLKEILNGTLDANALLGELSKIQQNYQDYNLFGDTSPPYGLPSSQEKDAELASGSELASYGLNVIDFDELLDDSLDNHDNTTILTTQDNPSTVNTPQIVAEEPIFPKLEKK